MKEIYDLNRGIMDKFEKIFEDRGIPVIPSLGNNDIYRESEFKVQMLETVHLLKLSHSS